MFDCGGSALASQGVEDGEKPKVIIGPFYTNLAMILEQLDIPYLVTDYKVSRTCL